MPRLRLGRIGASLDVTDTYLNEAAELEHLGYATIWLPGGQLRTLDPVDAVIRATDQIPVASSVSPTGLYDATSVAGLYADLERTHPGRFVVGLGGRQEPRQLAALNAYLDELDAADPPVPVERRMLAAIGPRKLALARDRTAGSLPLLVTPDYTLRARAALGPDSTLVIHQFVVLSTDPDAARSLMRGPLSFLSTVGGYVANFRSMGFDETDISALSDHLVDELTSWGDLVTIDAQVDEHLRAGADQVAVSVLNPVGGAGSRVPGRRETLRELARWLVSYDRFGSVVGSAGGS
jgi:probable F420-dependent oxidoreductase